MVFVFPRLPYEYNALEPFVDSLMMNLHHTKHHQTYVNMANKFIQTEQNGELKDMSLIEVVQNAKSENIRNNASRATHPDTHSLLGTTLLTNAYEIYDIPTLNSLFWTWMATPGTANTAPYGSLKERIEQDFGSLENMKTQFNDCAATRFGSGWTWLGVGSNGKLGITSTPNQDNPIMPDVDEPMIPILGLDVWEHAYFLQYQNRRPEYIHGFWNVVNWDQVVHCYEDFAAKQKPVPLEMEELEEPPISLKP